MVLLNSCFLSIASSLLRLLAFFKSDCVRNMCVFHDIDNNNILAISILIFAFIIIIIYFVCGSIIILNSALPCHALPCQVELRGH